MFSTFQNAAEISFRLVPDGPLMIRAQSVGLDPGLADMELVRTTHGGQRTVYLPGSSLKGVVRAHVERLLRSADLFACDPTNVRLPASCGSREHELGRPQPGYPHANQCPACFTFGSLKLAGRFRLDDAYPEEGREAETNRVEVRTSVGLARKGGTASTGALFDAEVITAGAFRARLRGENFSLWQVGLLLTALEHLDAGLFAVGGGKARGMGRVRVEDIAATFRFLDQRRGQLSGARRSRPDEPDYGLPPSDEVAIGPGGQERSDGLFRVVDYATVGALRETLAAGPVARYLATPARGNGGDRRG